VPTALMKQGNFSELPLTIYDPATTQGDIRQPFPNNTIPQSRFSRVSSNILPFIPDPNLGGLNSNYAFVNTSTLTDYIWSLKFDHSFTPNNRISYFQSLQDNNTANISALPGPLGQGLGTNYQKPRYYRVNHDWVVRPTFLIHTMFGFSQTRQGWSNPEQAGFASQIGLPADTDATPRILFATSDALTPWGVQDGKVDNGFQNNTTYHVTQGFSWIRGKHEFKFGWDVRRLQTTAEDKAGTNGRYFYERAQTALPTNTAGTGNSFASFLLGMPDRGETAALPIPDVQIRYGYHAGYFQDNWKVNPRLTLNIGLRYEVPIGFHFSNNQFSAVDLTVPNPGAGDRLGALVFAGEGEGRIGDKRFYPTDWGNIGPRFGFAYRLTNKTVLRGGYGIYYQTLGNGGCGCTLGFAGAPTQINSDGLSGAFPFDSGIPVPPNIERPPFIDPAFGNFRDVDYLGEDFGVAPRIHNWSFNVQHEVKSFLFDVAYVANRGYRLSSSLPLNQVDPSFLSLGALLRRPITDPAVAAAGFSKPFASFPDNLTLAQALRPYPQFLNVTSRNSGDGRTWYDSLQTKVERRFGAWQLMGSYVWSKSLAKLHYRQIFTQTQSYPQDVYNLEPEKSLSWFDLPHVVNILNSFDLPFGRGRKWLNDNRAVDLLLGGWTIAAAQKYYTGGLTNTVVSNSLSNALFNGLKRANRTGEPIRTSAGRGDLDPGDSGIRYFNAGAFAIPGEFEFGNAAPFYGEFRQPPVFQENLSIVKRFNIWYIGEQAVRLTYRADMFNLFNRTNFGINQTVGNAAFGAATGPQQGARIITMGLRAEF
ncbi:MAG: hypothetical protein ACRD7E_23960, partial [Bryobacteraceae bacterium]